MGDPAWFTVEAADADTFVISEYRHPEPTHCYLLLGDGRALLIDTGLGVSDIGAVVSSLTSLPVTVAATHVHWDPIGGHRHFSDIAVHEKEAGWLSACTECRKGKFNGGSMRISGGFRYRPV